jgi:hypothetical protein
LIQNQKLLIRIATLIAQTYAISVDEIMKVISDLGVEETIAKYENQPKLF